MPVIVHFHRLTLLHSGHIIVYLLAWAARRARRNVSIFKVGTYKVYVCMSLVTGLHICLHAFTQWINLIVLHVNVFIDQVWRRLILIGLLFGASHAVLKSAIK